jgi:hypothetical protein
MGRESENLRRWRGRAALARPTPAGASGAGLGGLHGRQDCRSGTKGQGALGVPPADAMIATGTKARCECRTAFGKRGLLLAIFCFRSRSD